MLQRMWRDITDGRRWVIILEEWNNMLITLAYDRTQNSWYTNPHMVRNNQLWEELKVLSKEQLIEILHTTRLR